MTRLTPQQNQWLTLGIGLVAALIWTSLGLRAIITDNDPSIKALFACAALALAGFALGSAMWILTAARRAKRPVIAAMLAESSAYYAMLGIMVIGAGAEPILDPSPSAWNWVLMAFTSLAGGVGLSKAFMANADQTAASVASRQSMRVPPSAG